LLVSRDGPAQVLNDGGGPPICVMEDFPYETACAACDPGDAIVLMSDGITEAMDRDGALYGRERLQALMQAPLLQASALHAIGDELLASVKAFEAGAEPADDQTLLVVRWLGDPSGRNSTGNAPLPDKPLHANER
jgi:serine phosphatase RsbU (regulator of sigma subunit)